MIAVTSAIAILGIATAVIMYKYGPIKKDLTGCKIYQLLINQYYIPKIYEKFFIEPYEELSRIFWKIDQKMVDSSVDFIATRFYKTGEATRGMQSGNLSNMLIWMVVGLVILLFTAVVLTQVLPIVADLYSKVG